MRPLLKSVMGGALALLLIVSASPAQAFEAPPAEDETTLTPGEEQTPAEEQAPAEETPEVPAEGEEAPEAETPAETAPEGAEVPEEEAQVPEDGTSAEATDPAEDAETGDVAAAPTALPLSGLVVTVPDEAHVSIELSESGAETETGEIAESEAGGGGTFILTEAGPILPAPEQEFVGDGSETFSGSLELSSAAQDAINAQIADAGAPITSAEALSIAEDVAEQSGEALAITGEATAIPPVADAVKAKAHTADVAFVKGGTNPGDTTLKGLVENSSSYWNSQTKGAVSKITPNVTVKSFSSSANRCDTSTLWTQAAQQFGRTPNSYIGSAKHLVVFINAGANCSGSGYGTLGTLHRGGLIWIDLQAIGSTPTTARGTLAHEFGHNFGLGHGQARVCSGNTTDVATTSQYNYDYRYTRQVPKSPCRDVEYGDVSNIMGAGSAMSGSKPAALSTVQKQALGVLPASDMKTVSASGGRSQTFTLNEVSASSGVRGIKVNTAGGGSFYVEYRSGRGQDDGLPWKNGQTLYFNTGGLLPSNYALSNGVQVQKYYPGKLATNVGGGNDLRESLITSLQNGKKRLALQNGQVLTPWNSNARVRVGKAQNGKVPVTIEFTRYTDVPYAYTHYSGIEWMAKKGYVASGASVPKYNPANATTRGAFATMLMRKTEPNFKVTSKMAKRLPYTDVKPSDTHYKGIVWMYERGYAAKASKFNAGNPVTRGAMATFMQRMEAKNYRVPSNLKMPYTDVKKTDTHYKGIAWMYQKKYAAGASKYNSANSTTRGAMATFFWRIYGK